jgi:uncharacterized protein (DUF433 family)
METKIGINPEIHFGKPCVAGTRIPVQDVLELVSEGIPFEEIIQDYYLFSATSPSGLGRQRG